MKILWVSRANMSAVCYMFKFEKGCGFLLSIILFFAGQFCKKAGEMFSTANSWLILQSQSRFSCKFDLWFFLFVWLCFSTRLNLDASPLPVSVFGILTLFQTHLNVDQPICFAFLLSFGASLFLLHCCFAFAQFCISSVCYFSIFSYDNLTWCLKKYLSS